MCSRFRSTFQPGNLTGSGSEGVNRHTTGDDHCHVTCSRAAGGLLLCAVAWWKTEGSVMKPDPTKRNGTH